METAISGSRKDDFKDTGSLSLTCLELQVKSFGTIVLLPAYKGDCPQLTKLVIRLANIFLTWKRTLQNVSHGGRNFKKERKKYQLGQYLGTNW